MDILTIFIFIVVTLFSFVYLFFRRQFTHWSSKGIVHVKPVFPYGNYKGLMKTHHIDKINQSLYNEFKGKAKYMGVYIWFIPSILALDLDFIKNVLIKDFNYFDDRGIYYNEKDDPLSAHLFSLDGPKWRTLRNKISPTFTSGKMKFMFYTMVDVGKHLVDTINEMIAENGFNDIELKDISGRYTTDVIGTCAFGIECNSLKYPNNEFRTIGKKFFSERRHSIFVEVLMLFFPNLCRKLGFKLTRDDVEEFYLRIVRETVKYREENNVFRNDFLQLLIQLKNQEKIISTEGEEIVDNTLTMNEIAAQATLFFVAGFETSSTLMGFCLYELALHTEIQDKLRAEIIDVLRRHDNKLTYEAAGEMIYLEMVIMETLRKYPPLGHLIRKAVKDYPVPETPHVIENGTSMLIPIYAIQHDPDIYENPDKFDPDRFSLDNIQNRHTQSFLSFGDGPRNCIGLRFGKMQVRIGLIKLLQSFKFEPCKKTRIPIVWNPKIPILNADDIYLKTTKI